MNPDKQLRENTYREYQRLSPKRQHNVKSLSMIMVIPAVRAKIGSDCADFVDKVLRCKQRFHGYF